MLIITSEFLALLLYSRILYVFFLLLFSKQGYTTNPRLTLNLQSSCLTLLSARFTGMTTPHSAGADVTSCPVIYIYFEIILKIVYDLYKDVGAGECRVLSRQCREALCSMPITAYKFRHGFLELQKSTEAEG